MKSRETLLEHASRGKIYSLWAYSFGARTALLSARGNQSFAELNGNANTLLARFHAHSLNSGDPVARSSCDCVRARLRSQDDRANWTPNSVCLASPQFPMHSGKIVPTRIKHGNRKPHPIHIH